MDLCLHITLENKVWNCYLTRLAFKRVMRNRKERFYASKVDNMININEINDIF